MTFKPTYSRRFDVRESFVESTWLLGAVFAGAILGLLSFRAPIIPILLIAAAYVAMIAQRRPDVLLAFGSFATLTSGVSGIGIQIGSFLLIVGGSAAAFRMLVEHKLGAGRMLVLPVFVLGWLALRLSMGSSAEYARPLLACSGAVLLAAACLVDRRDWVRSFAIAGALFTAMSYFLGETDLTGLRFQGISGNPNRMVFGLLVFMPIIFTGLVRARHIALRIITLVPIVLAIAMIAKSGSSQGLVGLTLLAAAALLYISRRIQGTHLIILSLISIALLTLVILSSGVMTNLDTDITTLSGRTSTYQAGFEEFMSAPVFGTGQIHVTSGSVVERATHSSTVTFAAATGIAGVFGWLLILARASIGSWRGLRLGIPAAAIGIVIATSQIVQTVELLPIAWAGLMLATTQGTTRAN